MSEEEQNNKMQRIALELNKSGLSHLANQEGPSSAFEYFKKAEKLLQGEIQIDQKNKRAQSLLAVSYNNIAIYYKRTSKPKAALTYLKKALQIEAIILNDWLAASTTHLNICAIYSYMSRHSQAVEHAHLAIQMAQKAKDIYSSGKNKNENVQKACNNIQLTGIYNLAVEYEHLKKFEEAIEAYKKARDYAKRFGVKKIQQNSEQSIQRLDKQMKKNKKKMIQLLQKKRQYQEKGNYQSMRRNKKNYKSIAGDKSPALEAKIEKYNIYNQQNKQQNRQNRAKSLAKIKSLKPFTFDKSTQVVRKEVNDKKKDEHERSYSKIQ